MTEIMKRGYPGIKSVKDMPILQDAPPPGGFPAIRIDRKFGAAGPTGIAIFGITAAIVGYGFYQLSQQKKETKFTADEIFTVRCIVHPVLQAEWDLRYIDHEKKKLVQEAEIMKNVPGWRVGEPQSKRWLPPLESFAKRPLI